MSNPADLAEEAPVAAAAEVPEQSPDPTPTPTNEPTSLAERKVSGFLTESRMIVLGEGRPPSVAEIRNALSTLSALAVSTAGADSELPPEDLLLCYHISMRAGNAEPFEVKGTRQLHQVLSLSGIPNAPSEVEAALLQLVAPFKARLMHDLNARLPVERGGAYQRLPGG